MTAVICLPGFQKICLGFAQQLLTNYQVQKGVTPCSSGQSHLTLVATGEQGSHTSCVHPASQFMCIFHFDKGLWIVAVGIGRHPFLLTAIEMVICITRGIGFSTL